jgi:hypothetical protein
MQDEIDLPRSGSKVKEAPVKLFPTIGCCGLDCGLCPRYYTAGPSRCPGCCGPDFFNKHPSCSYITCCVKKKNLEVCAQCEEFPCSKFESLRTNGGEYDSFATYRKVYPNMTFIKKYGLKKFIEQQNKRMKLLQTMLKSFNEGRSKSFYCLAAALLSIEALEKSLENSGRSIKENKIGLDNIKAKAQILRRFLEESAAVGGVELKLRKKGKRNGKK